MAGFSFVADPNSSGSINAGASGSQTSASFRDWVTKVHNSLITGGFQAIFAGTGTLSSFPILSGTTPSSSITGTMIPIPTGANHWPGYIVYQFADRLAGSAPIMFKVEYGAPGTFAHAGIAVTVGTDFDTTDTSASIKGFIANQRRTFDLGAPDSTTKYHRHWWVLGADGTGSLDPYFAFAGPVLNIDRCGIKSDGSGITVAAWINAPATAQQFFIIERTKSPTGSITSDGYVFYGRHSGSAFMQTVIYSGTIPPQETGLVTNIAIPNPASEAGMPVMGLFYCMSGDFRNALTGMVAAKNLNILDFDFLTLTPYQSVNHVYVKLPGITDTISPTNAGIIALMRWD